MRKKILSWILALAIAFTLIPTSALQVSAASGTKFDGVEWSIIGGVLTISKGTATDEYAAGEMGEVRSYEAWRSRDDEITKVIVEEGVKNIGDYALSYMPNAVEVEIADSVESIGLQAFTESTAMTSVELGEGIKEIGQEAFLSCSSLTEIEIPGSVKTIGQGAFRECESLTSVKFNEGLEHVGQYAFRYCPNLAQIDFPSTVKTVGEEAVYGTAAYNAQSENEFIICGSVLIGTNVNRFDIDHPCIIPEGVVCIANKVFVDVTITSLTLPESLKYIGNFAFDGGMRNDYQCDKTLTELDLKNVEYIGTKAFQYWHYIKDVDLSNVKYLGDYAFYWCNRLKTATLADNMEYMGEYVFAESDSMTAIYGPKYIEHIDAMAFKSCGAANDAIYVDPDNDGYIYYNGILLYATAKNDVNYAEDGYVIADGTYNIASRAFDYFGSSERATSITIPESVVSIGKSYIGMLNSITDVYYAGDMKGWKQINLEDPEMFASATIHCAKNSAVSVEDCTVKLGYTSKTYTGKALKPSVSVVTSDGKTLKAETDYVLVYSNNVNAGTAKVTITGQGDYIGTIEKTFTISKVQASKVTAKLEYQKTNYNGRQKKPAVTVTDSNGRKLEAGKDYEVTYPKTLGAGRYKVTIALGGTKGNYTGTKTVWFTIVPAATSTVVTQLSTATNGYNDVVVRWDIVSQASGYYLYYKKATSNTWSKAIDCGKNLRKYTVKNLADGVKYDFKVVAYWKDSNGTKYTSVTNKQSSITILKKVTNVAAAKSTTGKVKVSWSDINGESGYQIQKMKKASGVYVAVSSYTANANAKSKIIAHANGKQFYYRIRPFKTEKVDGKNKKVYGPWSAVKGIKR